MYYLLETNYIISEEEIKEEGFEIVDNTIGKWEKLDGKFGIKEWFNAYGFIKKQSNNVIDLIEVGDLIKHNQKFDEEKFEKILGKRIWLGVEWLETNDFYSIDGCSIIAIYKPNSKGDYIKVWEKESE